MAARAIAAQRYIDSIRNPRKRGYAVRFLRYLRNGAADSVGALPGDRGELSFMAAQAVEIRLRAIWRGEA